MRIWFIECALEVLGTSEIEYDGHKIESYASVEQGLRCRMPWKCGQGVSYDDLRTDEQAEKVAEDLQFEDGEIAY